MIAVDDAGTIINPMIADGQVHGGAAAGIAQALYEQCAFDAEQLDAGSHLGVRHIDMPANGKRWWRAIQAARARA